MSNATVIQLYDRIFIGADSAVSTEVEGKLYRTSEDGKKLFVIDDKVIYCSGNMNLSYLVMGHYQINKDRSIESLALIAKELFGIYGRVEFALDIMLCTIQNGKSIVYQISPYNNFEIIKKELSSPDQYAVWTGGIKTKESHEIANQMLLSGRSISDIYRTVFSKISYEGVGGLLTVYSLSDKDIVQIINEPIVENQYERLNFNTLYSQHLIVGEYIYGTLGAFAKVTASSIIIGDDNKALPDSVIASSSNWNSIYDNAVDYADKNLQAAKAYSDTTLVSANGHANQINSAIRNDLRLTSTLPTSISLNQSGITATTTSDPLKFARLDHRGLYIQNGALQITSTDGTTIIDGSGVNASKITTGILSGINMSMGSGNAVVKIDGNGLYAGNANFGAAPFRVDYSGNVTANNITLSGTINSSRMNNSDIVGGTLTIGSGNSIFKADMNGIYLGSTSATSAPFWVKPTGEFRGTNATLINANISGNINMTSGTISWSNIGSDPTIATAQTTANTAVHGVTALASGTYSGTFINGKMIYSPTLQGGRIIGNSIEGSTITGATIIGGVFKTADSGNRIELNSGGLNSYNGSNQLHGVRIESSNYSSLGFWSDGTFRGSVEAISGGLQIKPSGGDLVLNANTNTVVMHGKVDFSDAVVTGLVPVFG